MSRTFICWFMIVLVIPNCIFSDDPAIPDEITEESKSFLRFLYSKPPPQLTVDDVRKVTDETDKELGGYFAYKGERNEVMVPSSQISEGIPVWIYTPEVRSKNPPIVVYFHGGGFVTGNRHQGDIPCKIVSTLSESVIVNVEYRLAPEHTFPASHDDSETVLRWVLENKATIGGAKSKVGVMGDSAGGNIAASIVHDVDGVDFQILVYPNIDLGFQQESYQKFGLGGYFLTLDRMNWFRSLWLPDLSYVNNSRAAPLLRPAFDKVPPAVIMITGSDPLSDEGIEYANKLTDAGVKMKMIYFNNTIHMPFHLAGVFNQTSQRMYLGARDFIMEINKAEAGMPNHGDRVPISKMLLLFGCMVGILEVIKASTV